MLFLVGTPIGNLDDFSYRGVKTLECVEYILAEDTRKSSILLGKYEIKTPLKSFHGFNEKSKEDAIVADLKNEIKIALISDAGMPGICDPGCKLVKRCHEEGIEINVVPGPSAVTSALSLSGYTDSAFQFVGFLPKKQKSLQACLMKMILYEGISVGFETPHHIEKSLLMLKEMAPDQGIKLARELTKIYEEVLSGTADELLQHFKAHPPKGEFVMMLQGRGWRPEGLPQEQVGQIMTQYGIEKKEAIKVVAEMNDVRKRELYLLEDRQ